MTDTSPWWDRLLGRSKDEPVSRPTVGGGEVRELAVRVATVGLCFDYERDLAFESAVLSDAGLEHILGVLQRHELRATFNCAAKLCEDVRSQIQMIADAGHELAVYGYAGESWAEMTPDVMKQMAYRCRNAFAR